MKDLGAQELGDKLEQTILRAVKEGASDASLLELTEVIGEVKDRMESLEEVEKELGPVCVEALQGKYEGIVGFAKAYPITVYDGKLRVKIIRKGRVVATSKGEEG